jgi:hypothetical protein
MIDEANPRARTTLHTTMTPADIDVAAHTLRPRGWRSAVIPWSDVAAVRATRLESLADEVELTLRCGAAQFYVREDDRGFSALCLHLQLAQHWGANWLARVEAGEVLTVEL